MEILLQRLEPRTRGTRGQACRKGTEAFRMQAASRYQKDPESILPRVSKGPALSTQT